MVLLRCYARVTDWIYEVFNHAPAADFRFVPIYSYGFWVAIGFFCAASLAVAEMRRREKLGLLKGNEQEVIVGAPVNYTELGILFFIAFTVFYKVTGIFAYHAALMGDEPQLQFGRYFIANPDGGFFDKIISIYTYGSFVGGVLLAGALTAYYYYTARQQQLPEPQKKVITVTPSENIGDLVIIAAVLGILGAVLFNFLESGDSIERFKQDPIGFVTSGLSVYGGLICAGIGFGIYAYYKKFNLAHFFDSVAPGFMLANGIGRLGCQTAGDGDWGIPNLAPKPGWLPQWLWSDYYEHNIIDEGVKIPGCIEQHCHMLAQPAYPTPIYEFLMCTAVFLILWSLRKRLTYKPGMVFFIFMILIGIQRFAIEQWRDNSGRDLYNFFGFALRQSELISIVLFLIGVSVTAYLYKRYKNVKPPETA